MIIQRISRVQFLVLILMLAAVLSGTFLLREKGKINEQAKARIIAEQNKQQIKELNEKPQTFAEKVTQRVADFFHPTGPDVPPPPSMERMKKQGCVVDGVFNGYGGDTKNLIKMINRSECYYLHRSIETWLDPPDFKDIKKNIKRIEKGKDFVHGMFIAEAIDTKAKYNYPAEKRKFDFSKMCKPGSKNFWGEHTCKPTLARSEYRRYVRYITEQAMDLGVQSFMFGQVYYQDSQSNPVVPEVIKEMKEYAAFKGMEIVVGAQTNDIEDEKYLKYFDFIEGGVGLDSNGRVEDGPCFSRWWKKEGDWCWALLWHEKFSSKANDVFVHLDWSGKKGDDMSTFALMSSDKRQETLTRLHRHFDSKNVGFLMPMFAVLPKENGGCHAKSRKFYSANNKYSCKDEDVINKILKK